MNRWVEFEPGMKFNIGNIRTTEQLALYYPTPQGRAAAMVTIGTLLSEGLPAGHVTIPSCEFYFLHRYAGTRSNEVEYTYPHESDSQTDCDGDPIPLPWVRIRQSGRYLRPWEWSDFHRLTAPYLLAVCTDATSSAARLETLARQRSTVEQKIRGRK